MKRIALPELKEGWKHNARTAIRGDGILNQGVVRNTPWIPSGYSIFHFLRLVTTNPDLKRYHRWFRAYPYVWSTTGTPASDKRLYRTAMRFRDC